MYGKVRLARGGVRNAYVISLSFFFFVRDTRCLSRSDRGLQNMELGVRQTLKVEECKSSWAGQHSKLKRVDNWGTLNKRAHDEVKKSNQTFQRFHGVACCCAGRSEF